MGRGSGQLGGLSGAERPVGGQLDELCNVFSPDLPLRDGSKYPLKINPQVSEKYTRLFLQKTAHNSLN